jgi:hypothetical protein
MHPAIRRTLVSAWRENIELTTAGKPMGKIASNASDRRGASDQVHIAAWPPLVQLPSERSTKHMLKAVGSILDDAAIRRRQLSAPGHALTPPRA